MFPKLSPALQLSHFDELISWITPRKSSGGVLVHCVHGVSRSVYVLRVYFTGFYQHTCSTVVIAFLMKTESLDADAAFARVKSVYPPAAPNEGFLEQLRIYGEMGAELKPQHRSFRAFRLSQQAHQVTSVGATRSTVAALHVDAESQPLAPGVVLYACRACRKRLFLGETLIAHEKGRAGFERKHGAQRSAQEDCTSHFIETYTWMGDLMSLEGKLNCPKCSARVGSFNWAGMQCSCGTWVRPAFQVVKSKVDEIALR